MSQTYYAILTAAGEAKLANAAALNQPLQISRMAVGDGNGTLPTPNRTQTALAKENYRADLNSLIVDPANASQLIAELVIPETTGGWWIREMGLYDASGVLIAVCNCPPSYKPQLAEGSGRTQVLRMVLIVSSTSAVELKIDPSVVLATRTFVDTSVQAVANQQGYKAPALAATTGVITLSGLQTLDGVVLSAGDRVLVKDQTVVKDNGLYVVSATTWTRAQDADSSLEVRPGMLVHVQTGVVNANSLWQLVSNHSITPGTSDQVFEMAVGYTGVAAGTFRSVTVDRYGRVVAGTNPTTLDGYGITIASQAEAEANDASADNTKPMSALRVFQAIAKRVVQATEAIVGSAKVATQAQTNAGTDDATIVTPKKLRAGFLSNLAATGYIVFPSWLGGFVVQWGSVSLAQDAITAMTFPLAFPTQCVFALASGTKSSISTNAQLQTAMNCTVKSTTGASFANDDSVQTAQWFAIGY